MGWLTSDGGGERPLSIFNVGKRAENTPPPAPPLPAPLAALCGKKVILPSGQKGDFLPEHKPGELVFRSFCPYGDGYTTIWTSRWGWNPTDHMIAAGEECSAWLRRKHPNL